MNPDFAPGSVDEREWPTSPAKDADFPRPTVESVQWGEENLVGRIALAIDVEDARLMAGMLQALVDQRRDLPLLRDLASLLAASQPYRGSEE